MKQGECKGGRRRGQAGGQRGVSLIELMIAMTVLAVGLLGTLALILSAASSNNRNKLDTGATFMAQSVLEHIVNQSPTVSPTLAMVDCAGTAQSINTAGSAMGAGGSGALLYTTGTAPSGSQVNDINFTQAIGAVPAGYRMSYVSCDSAGTRTTYDVRWNIVTLNANSKMVTVGARPLGAVNNNIKLFAPPVSLRTIVTN